MRPDLRDGHADFERVAVFRRPPVVALHARQDHAGPAGRQLRRAEPPQRAPVREARLLEVGEVDGVVDVAQRIAVAKSDLEPMDEMSVPCGIALTRDHAGRAAEIFHGRRAANTRAILHQHRQARLRADEPAGNGQGGAVRALLALREVAAAAVPRRVRRQPRGRSRPKRRRSASSAPKSCTRRSSTSTATTRSRSWAARTSRASTSRTS